MVLLGPDPRRAHPLSPARREGARALPDGSLLGANRGGALDRRRRGPPLRHVRAVALRRSGAQEERATLRRSVDGRFGPSPLPGHCLRGRAPAPDDRPHAPVLRDLADRVADVTPLPPPFLG